MDENGEMTEQEFNPVCFRPENIGDVVTILSFARKADGNVDLSSMERVVGKLLSYSISKSACLISIEGLTPMFYPYANYHVELFVAGRKAHYRQKTTV